MGPNRKVGRVCWRFSRLSYKLPNERLDAFEGVSRVVHSSELPVETGAELERVRPRRGTGRYKEAAGVGVESVSGRAQVLLFVVVF